jgi:hypothetical protein
MSNFKIDSGTVQSNAIVTAAVPFNGTIGDGTNNFILSTNACSYTRIGNLVTVNCNLVWSSHGSAVDGTSLKVTLPFSTAGNIDVTSFAIGPNSGITFSEQLVAFTNSSQPFVFFQNNRTGTTATGIVCSSAAVSGQLSFTGTYNAVSL